MQNGNRTGRQADATKEKTLLETHPGAWVSFGDYVLGTVLIVPFFWTLACVHPFFPWTIWIALAGLACIGRGLAAQCCTTYTVTSRRVIVERGFLSSRRTEILIRDIRNISCEAGVAERLLGIGTVSVGTAATGGMEIRMPGIPSPQTVANVIDRLRN
jgi:membrane protein YdbS with pleckstrin-like domain